MSSDIGYATAHGETGDFHVAASSSVFGSQSSSRGLAAVTGEGGGRFEVDFVVHSDEPEVIVDLTYVISGDFVSTDPVPPFPFDGPGTDAFMGILGLSVVQDGRGVFGPFGIDAVQPGEHVSSGRLLTETRYRLEMDINAVSVVIERAGYASAATGLDVVLSARPVPEPGTGTLLAAALVALAAARSARAR